MSFHVAPSSQAVIASRALNGASAFANGPDDDRLSVRLGHMGVVVAISPASRGTTALTPVGSETDTIHLQAAAANFARVSGWLGEGQASADPLVARLSDALAAAERSEEEFGGIYADALRLAIVTRVLTARAVPEAMPVPAELPATEHDTVVRPQKERSKSGLPKWRLKRVTAYIEENLAESVTLVGMAEAAGLSRMHFAAQFRVTTGVRPHDFLLRRRIERAQAMMLETRDSLVEIALGVGFQTQAHFTTVFRRLVGDTPYQWRAANRGRN